MVGQGPVSSKDIERVISCIPWGFLVPDFSFVEIKFRCLEGFHPRAPSRPDGLAFNSSPDCTVTVGRGRHPPVP